MNEQDTTAQDALPPKPTTQEETRLEAPPETADSEPNSSEVDSPEEAKAAEMPTEEKKAQGSTAKRSKQGGVGRIIGGAFRGLGFQVARTRRFLFRGRIPDYPVIVLDGALTEREPQLPWWQQFVPGRRPPVSLEALEAALKKVVADPKTKGVLFLFKSPQIGLTQAQSLLMLFDRFRAWDAAQRNSAATPKQIIVHIEDGMMGSFIAACGADQIYMTPLTEWRVLGLRMGGIFLKDTLARIGVEFDVLRIAPWKSAGDMYDRTEMSEESRTQYNWLLDSLYASLVTIISQRRKLSAERVKELIDQAPLKAEQCLAADLIDGIYYEDEIGNTLSWGSKSAVLKPYDECARLLLRKPIRRESKAIGVISLSGTIVPGKSRDLPVPLPLLGNEQIGSITVQQIVRSARENESLAAIVLHVDSPGGSALASDVMWRELMLLNDEKPVVVYMGRVAASGGYYISTPAQKIVAQPTTVTGSIGVLSAKPSTEGTYSKIGVGRDSVQRGANAAIYEDDMRWTPEQKSQMEDGIHFMYDEFKDRVAQGRGLDFDRLDPICQGRVWTGEQALEHGLVDALGDLQTAVEQACQLADLPSDGNVSLINLHPPREPLLAAPQKVVEEELGFSNLGELRELLSTVATGSWSKLLHAEQYWFLAEDLPKEG
ncbi:MAG: signal peptide peptidase SppA [Chloroflexota bacterium]